MTFFLATTQQSRANATGEEWTKGAYILCNLLLGCSQLVFHYYEICLKVDFSRYFCVKVPQLQPKKNERFLVQCSSITNLVLKQIFLEKKTKPDNQCVLQNNISRTLIVIYESRDLPCSHVQVRHFFFFFLLLIFVFWQHSHKCHVDEDNHYFPNEGQGATNIGDDEQCPSVLWWNIILLRITRKEGNRWK